MAGGAAKALSTTLVDAGAALEAERDDAETISQAAWTLVFLAGEATMAVAALDRALALNPNAANAWQLRGLIHAVRNQPEAAIEAIERARRLSPFDPSTFFYAGNTATAPLAAQRFEQAIECSDTRFAADSPLEGAGFEPLVPGVLDRW